MSQETDQLEALHKAAEAKLPYTTDTKQVSLPAEKLLHELRVHQIELEMQNEELRQTHIKLEESRDRYVDLYDLAPVGYLTLDHDGMIKEVNLTGAKLLGVARNKLMQYRLAYFVAREDSNRWYRHFQDVLAAGDTLACELALKRDDGSRIDARLDCQCLKKDSEKPAVRVMMTDITERRKAEKALLESEARFRVALENSPIVVFNQDRELRYTWIHNPHPEFDQQTVLGKTDAELLPADEAAVLTEIKRCVLEAGATARKQVQTTIGGQAFFYDLTVEPLRDQSGNITGVTCATIDITERKQAEHRMTATLDTMTRLHKIGTLYLREENPEPVFTEIVDTAIAITGADFGNIQLLDEQSAELKIVAQRGFPKWWIEFWDRTRKGKGVCGTALERGERVIIEDVEQNPIFAGTHALDIQLRAGVRAVQSTPLVSRSGKLLGIFSTHYKMPCRPDDHALQLLDILARHAADIIERRHSEEKLSRLNAELEQRVTERTVQLVAAKEEAERASRAKSSFLATMSHEIRTPLTGMLGMLEILSLTPLDREQNEILKAVWDSSRNLFRIVNDILDWSKIEEGKLAIESQPTSIAQLLQEVVNTYLQVASSKKLVLLQHADARLSTAYLVDPQRLSQVLNNFVSNALKFTQCGEVEVRADLLERVESGERIRFSVRDTGIGIASEAQAQLFQRYQQGSGDTSRMYGGTGLGLSICKRLADLMDGQIELSSEPGEGSTFCITLTLPVSSAPVDVIGTLYPDLEQKKISPLLDADADAQWVLAVDDNRISRDLLAHQLKLLGLRVETAEDGKAALALWQKGRFALVITDCHMPVMDGYALTRAIRKIEVEEKLPRTPVIAWTANALPEEKQHCQAAGMDELLVKSGALIQLKNTLVKWLRLAETDRCQSGAAPHETGSGHAPLKLKWLNAMTPDDAARFQHTFLTSLHADHNQLIKDLEHGHPANVWQTAHRMKGSCKMFGTAEMASTCSAIEQAARNGNLEGARSAMTMLNEAICQFENQCRTIGAIS